MDKILDYHGETKKISDYEGQHVYVGHREGGSRGFVHQGKLYAFRISYKERINPPQLIKAAAQNVPNFLLKAIPQKNINKIAEISELSPIETTIKEAFQKISEE